MSELSPESAVEAIVIPRTSDIGNFEVRRALPSMQKRTVGPFVFLDEMGPAVIPAGIGLDVRPHPHIGLETVTYLFDGSILHRDGLGSIQLIEPGEVNWMTAGRGIVHSERSTPEARRVDQRVFGLQMWVALPHDKEEMDPSFIHYGLDAQPVVEGEGVWARVVAGSLFGRTSGVKTQSPLFYGDIKLEPGASVVLSAEHVERAAYLAEGTVQVEGIDHPPGRLLAFAPGRPVTLTAVAGPARFAV
ncbi:MAG TPA: pirin family protein, partial [Bordetella sp.]